MKVSECWRRQQSIVDEWAALVHTGYVFLCSFVRKELLHSRKRRLLAIYNIFTVSIGIRPLFLAQTEESWQSRPSYWERWLHLACVSFLFPDKRELCMRLTIRSGTITFMIGPDVDTNVGTGHLGKMKMLKICRLGKTGWRNWRIYFSRIKDACWTYWRWLKTRQLHAMACRINQSYLRLYNTTPQYLDSMIRTYYRFGPLLDN